MPMITTLSIGAIALVKQQQRHHNDLQAFFFASLRVHPHDFPNLVVDHVGSGTTVAKMEKQNLEGTKQ